MSIGKWNLKYFDTGEYQVIEERLDDLQKQGLRTCPARKNLFRALKLVGPEDVRVAIIGQDPYPTFADATGVAFSVADGRRIPPSLSNIFDEYERDLHYPRPQSGNLEPWCKQGVLLWNAIPSCTEGKPASHRWCEWDLLTQEIITQISALKSAVVVCMGNVALSLVSPVCSLPLISVSHPSPLGARKGKHPFIGSRLFTTVNAKLKEIGVSPVNWRL